MAPVETVLTAVGILAFALSGALMAVRKDMDVVGMAVLATLTALGGGVLRDLLLGVAPAALRTPWWLVVVLAAVVATFFFHGALTRLRRAVLVCDAVGLGLFCATSTALALANDVGGIAAVLVGSAGGVAGGVLRDVLAGEIPSVLRRDSQLYAAPAVLGAALVVAADAAGLSGGWVLVVAGSAIALVRLLALWRGWRAPAPRQR